MYCTQNVFKALKARRYHNKNAYFARSQVYGQEIKKKS